MGVAKSGELERLSVSYLSSTFSSPKTSDCVSLLLTGRSCDLPLVIDVSVGTRERRDKDAGESSRRKVVGPSNVMFLLKAGLTGKSKPAFSRIGELCTDAEAEATRGRIGMTGTNSSSSSSMFRKELIVLVLDRGPRRGADACVVVGLAELGQSLFSWRSMSLVRS